MTYATDRARAQDRMARLQGEARRREWLGHPIQARDLQASAGILSVLWEVPA